MSWLRALVRLSRLTCSRRGITISLRVPGTRLRLVWQRSWRKRSAVRRMKKKS